MDIDTAYRSPGHPAAYSGINQLKRHFPNANPEQFLSTVDSYTQHRHAKKPKFRNPIFVYRKREILQVDLADLRSIMKSNNGIQYLLLAIDTFSRYAWIRPLKNKSTAVVTAAMKSILAEMGEKPKRLLSDSGSEFKSREFQNLLRLHGISHTTSTAEIKAPDVERFTGTIKRLLSGYMTEQHTWTYIDKLDSILSTYNNRGHRALDFMSPEDAESEENRERVLEVLNKKYQEVIFHGTRQPKFKVGDIVRLRIYNPVFRKGHRETFTSEMFKIKQVITRLPITQYVVETYNGSETIRGRFYSNELQLCSSSVFKVERVLRRRTVNGKIEYYVKWLHFGPEYNSWITQAEFENRDDSNVS